MPNYYVLGEIGLLYRIILRGALPIGAVAGFTSSFAKPDTTPMKQFTKTIGYTTMGIMTGLSYPISFPGLTIYTFYKEYSTPSTNVSPKN